MPAPDPEAWRTVDPAAAGVDPDRLADAVEYAKLRGTPPSDVAYDYSNLDHWDEAEGEYGHRIGPMPDRRGGPAGVVLKGGRPVAEWGDTTRVDHAFSVAKTFLAVVAGVAYDRGIMESPTDRVGASVDDGGFESDQNAPITWEQFLQGTSEWEGTLFGKPDHVDRNRGVGKTGGPGKEQSRDLREPGTFWEYNDVRINRLALSLLRLWAKPLPRVLAHEVMDPIGATRTWEWHGYHNADVEVEGRTMKSVSGGGHWGAGLWISARDLARAGQLLLERGSWGEKRLLSTEWVDRMCAPCDENENYGYLTWLNTDRRSWPDVPESSFAMLGHGQNCCWVDPEHDLVVVSRWLARDHDAADRPDRPSQNGLFRRVVDAVE
jgi:CubicO group peptidase (beta-lactamase class C family)